jgi:ABC-type uncharacterized transport system substrate-binding protein
LAQTQPKRPIIGFLATLSKAAGERIYSGFPQGMRELGYVEGRDYVFEGRYADGNIARLPLLAEELVRLKPNVIVTSTTTAVLAGEAGDCQHPDCRHHHDRSRWLWPGR